MSLRYRLFFWVSGLFVLAATFSYFLENHTTAKEMKIAIKNMRAKIEVSGEEKRVSLQEFVGESIAENMVKIDAVLDGILKFSPQALRFAPTDYNTKQGTWASCASLVLEYKWMGLLQNTAGAKELAGFQPYPPNRVSTYQIPINQDLFWSYFGDDPKPYIAVRVPYVPGILDGNRSQGEVLKTVAGEVPVIVLLFDAQQMIHSPVPQFKRAQEMPSIPVRWTEGYAIDMGAFMSSFRAAWQGLSSQTLTPPQVTPEELRARMQSASGASPTGQIPAPFLTASVGGPFEERLTAEALQYAQTNLLWLWVSLFNSGLFGEDIFAFPAPASISVFSEGGQLGLAVRASDVLLPEPVFDDASYFVAHAPHQHDSGLALSMAVIPLGDRLFLGDTAQFIVDQDQKSRAGYLTLAISAEALLQQWLPALGKTTLLVHQGKIFAAYDKGGQKIQPTPSLALSPLLSRSSGIIPWEGENYFFSHLQPFAAIDLHLILLNPEKVEFALLTALEQGAAHVAHAILFNIHLTGLVALSIALILLFRLSKTITEPITELALATSHVARGHFDKIELRSFRAKHHDEIALLYQSFAKMITGLQEREKVKGVLNKVVSPEVAQEILKGSIHLGGEEKVVTVLFADIRNFTHMTQHLTPHAVIELLNTCMSRLSAIVDKHHGVIDKYVGDEVMALFGAPLATSQDPLNAILAAMDMHLSIAAWNQERAAKQLPAVSIGIGVHTGPMLVGNMGSENRLNYTVLGSNVNLAARLCSAAKAGEILISEATLEQVSSYVVAEPLEPLSLKGFDTPFSLYRLRGLSSNKKKEVE
jgi:class 3 adenylate cyclase